MADDRVGVLFVCLGNICRSPSAEAVFTKLVGEAGLDDRFHIDSAGIIDFHRGNRADGRMRRHGSKRGLDLASISRPVLPEDFDTFEFVVAMDEQNVQDLLVRAPSVEHRERIVRMMSYAAGDSHDEVPDPYYGGSKGFELVLDLLEDACAGLLDQIRRDRGW